MGELLRFGWVSRATLCGWLGGGERASATSAATAAVGLAGVTVLVVVRLVFVVAVCVAVIAWLAELPLVAALVLAAAVLVAFGGLAVLRLCGGLLMPWWWWLLLLRRGSRRQHSPRSLRLWRARTLLTLSHASLGLPVLLLAVALVLLAGGGLQVAVLAALAVLGLFAVLGLPRQAFLVQQAAAAEAAAAAAATTATTTSEVPDDDVVPVRARFWVAVVLESLVVLGLLVLIAWGLSRVAFPLFQVPTGSMWPTLSGGVHGEGDDVILVDATTTWGSSSKRAVQFDRFDMLVFEHPGYPDKLVKRAVAFGNETVQLRGGSVWINGEVAARPLAVQHEQMRRAPILHAQPRRDFGERPAERAAAVRAFHETLALWHATRETQTHALAEEVAHVLEVDPQMSPLASDAWRMNVTAAPRYLLDPHERSLWQRAQPAQPHLGYDLGYDADARPTRSRLVVRKPIRDPAHDHARMPLPSPHLGIELELERLGEWPEHSGRITVGVRVHAQREHAFEQHLELHVPPGRKPATLGGRVARYHQGTLQQRHDVAAHEVGAWPAGGSAAQVRLHTVDGRFDAWFDGRRLPGAEARPALFVPATAQDVVVWVESDVPVRIVSLRIVAATSYLATGPLREPLKVPADHLVFLGDHTHASSDSREWEMVHYRWPDGRLEKRGLHEDTGITTTHATQLVPREAVPAKLLTATDEQWPAEIPEALTLLSTRMDGSGQLVARDEVVVYWYASEMSPEQKTQLLRLSDSPAWQDAIKQLAAKAGTLPRRLGKQAAPFVPQQGVVGRVLAVISPEGRLRRVR